MSQHLLPFLATLSLISTISLPWDPRPAQVTAPIPTPSPHITPAATSLGSSCTNRGLTVLRETATTGPISASFRALLGSPIAPTQTFQVRSSTFVPVALLTLNKEMIATRDVSFWLILVCLSSTPAEQLNVWWLNSDSRDKPDQNAKPMTCWPWETPQDTKSSPTPEKEETKRHLPAANYEDATVLSSKPYPVPIQAYQAKCLRNKTWPLDTCRLPVHHSSLSHKGKAHGRNEGSGSR